MDVAWSKGSEPNSKRTKKQTGGKRRAPEGNSWSPNSSKALSSSGPSLPDIRPASRQGGSEPSRPASRQLGEEPRRPNTVGTVGELRSSSASSPLLPSGGSRQATGLQKGANLRMAAFMDRQMSHPAIEARKNMTALQKQIVTEGKNEDEARFWGNRGLKGFRIYLRRKFGSIVAGWRALDMDKNGRLSFYEFCNALRSMGYHGNVKMLWRQLDVSGDGFVSLMEIDPEVGRAVGTFKLGLMKKYGDMLQAWKKGLDVNGNGRIEEPEIETAIRDLGLDLNAKKLYSYLRGPSSLGLTLQDFDPDAYKRMVTGDLKGLTFAANKEFLEDLPGLGSEDLPEDILVHDSKHSGGGARQFRKELTASDRKEVTDAVAENTRLRLGLHTVAGFKIALVNRCGSLWAAWKEHLDLDGNGRLTFGEFTQALSRLAFHGDVKGLWKQLDVRGMGYIVFGDFDKETHDAITELKEKLCKEHGNMLLAWMKGLDAKGANCVDEVAFVKGCEKVGFVGSDDIDAAQLFRLMRPEAGRKFLSLKDFDTRAYNALSRGDFRMLSENEEPEKKRPMEMTFDERQNEGFCCQLRRAWDSAQRDEFRKACRIANSPDHLINSSEDFEHLITRKCGSIINAWRTCLDIDQNGKLTFNEFCKAVRWFGYGGDLNSLWTSYDTDKKGFIVLKDMDPVADNHVSSLLSLLNQRYGDLDNAWKNGFNKDPHDSIDQAELIQACDMLGYPHDPKKLFKCLQPVPGRLLITIWDLDPTESRKRQQGKDGSEARVHLNNSVPKSPTSKPGQRRPSFGEYDAGSMDEGLDGAHNNSTSTVSVFRSNSPDTRDDHKRCREALKQKHGSSAAAWRAHFDPDLTGAVSFSRFVIVLNDCSFYGNVKSMWKDLAGERSQITFKDLDPDGSKILDECRQFILDNADNLIKGWHTLLDTDGVERVDEADFLDRMAGKVKSPKKLFRLLLARHGQRSIKVEDLETLLLTVPATERKAIWGGSGEEMVVEIGPDATNGSVPGIAEASPRYQISQQVASHTDQDMIISDLQSFKKMLVVKYGSVFSAWRRVLDVDQNGVVNIRDFATACQRLGVKEVQSMWAKFDKNKDGQISLNEMDPECAKLFNLLEQLLVENYGSTKDGWRKVFDKENRLRCDREQFVSKCEAIGFEGDADKLFKLLRPEPGRNLLAFDDLWTNVNRNEYKLKAHAETLDALNFTQGSPRSSRATTPGSTLRPQSQGSGFR